MTNLFQDNLSNAVVLKANSLAVFSRFAEGLIGDLVSTFDAHVSNKRESQDCIEYTVYSQDQKNRYGWGSTFKVTSQGVEFQDDRGVKVSYAMALLGMPKDEIKSDSGDVYWFGGTYDRISDANPKFWALAQKYADKSEASIKQGDCYGNNGMRIQLILTPDDKRLNDKIKIVIGCLMEHGITTKLNR